MGDICEILSEGITPAQALERSYRTSVWSRTLLIDGEIAAVGGCAGTLLSGIGHPWLLTTAAVERIPVGFVREGQRQIAEMLTMFPVLENCVDAKYAQACRFLGVLGFSLGEPFRAAQGVFRRFRMERV
jgi:hypothetical protein